MNATAVLELVYQGEIDISTDYYDNCQSLLPYSLYLTHAGLRQSAYESTSSINGDFESRIGKEDSMYILDRIKNSESFSGQYKTKYSRYSKSNMKDG